MWGQYNSTHSLLKFAHTVTGAFIWLITDHEQILNLTMLIVMTSLYAWEVSPAMVPEPLRFSTPSPSSLPMMSVMMYLRHEQKCIYSNILLIFVSGCPTRPALFWRIFTIIGWPWFSILFHMATVNRVGGTDASVVLRGQIEVLKALRKKSNSLVKHA